jgi:hypothetical protein
MRAAIYAGLLRIAWASAYGVALIVLYGILDPLRTGAATSPLLFGAALAGGILVVVLARLGR